MGLAGRVLGQSSEVFWRQTGVGSNASVQQSLLGGGVAASAVTMVQVGSANELVYRQHGEGNTARFQQAGDANRLEVNLTGANNRLSVDQLGNHNLLSLPDVRSNGADVQVIQRGNGNELTRQGTLSTGGVPMRIEQTGGMHVILTNGITP